MHEGLQHHDDRRRQAHHQERRVLLGLRDRLPVDLPVGLVLQPDVRRVPRRGCDDGVVLALTKRIQEYREALRRMG